MTQFFKNVPDDVILYIFSKLSRSDLARVARVDQHFNHLTKNSALELARYKASTCIFKLGDLDLVFRLEDKFAESEKFKNKIFDSIFEVFSKSGNYLKLFKHYIVRESGCDRPIQFKPNANYYIRGKNILINRDSTQLMGAGVSRKVLDISQEELALFDQELKLTSLASNVPRVLALHEVKSVKKILGESSNSYFVGRIIFECGGGKFYNKLLEATKNKDLLALSKILCEHQYIGLAKVIDTEYKLQKNESKSFSCRMS